MADAFKGPPQKQGVIGRLVLDRALLNYGFDIYFGIKGLSSESIAVYGETTNGALVQGPTVHDSRTLNAVEQIQNGSFVIRIDDIKGEWDSLAFVKSGGLDNANIQIDSVFQWVDAPSRKMVAGGSSSTVPSVDGWGFGGWGSMPWGG